MPQGKSWKTWCPLGMHWNPASAPCYQRDPVQLTHHLRVGIAPAKGEC